jgi:heterodisulfide reductase subunit A
MPAPNSQSPREASRPRVGVYVCHCGGNISDVVDVQKVTEAAKRLPDVVLARQYTFMCSDPGQQMIIEDIAKEGLSRVVVAACSPSLHELTFRQSLIRAGLNPFLFEHVNIREQVSWVTKSDPGGATEKAVRLIAAAVAKVRLSRPLEPIRVEAVQQVVVIGGGVSGLRCASHLARRGIPVVLLERSPFLGGRVAQLCCLFPTQAKADQLLKSLISEVSQDPNVAIHTSAEVIATSGYIGNFALKVRLHPRGVARELRSDEAQAAIEACPETVESEFDYGLAKRKAIYVTSPDSYPPMPAIDWKACTRCGKCAEAVEGNGIVLDAEPVEIDLKAGAIVLATGFDPYEPYAGEYGYGQYSQVITLPQLYRLLNPQGPTGGRLERNGQPVRNVCLIHCVGSRQIEGIHQPGPHGRIYDYCSRVCCTTALEAANEIRQRYPEVNVFDFYRDIRTYGRGHEDYYENASRRGVLFFRYMAEEPPTVRKAAAGNGSPLAVTVKDTLTWGEEVEVQADLVVLVTGMKPRDITGLVETLKVARSPDGFLQEVHPKLRPVETAVSGVFLAGACQAPMDIGESCAAASAAAVKVSATLLKGCIELAPFVATVDPERCQGSGACIEECRYQKAISLCEVTVNGTTALRAQVNPALCRGCGMCVPTCPQGAIQLEGCRVDQFDAMIEAITADY